MSTEQRRPDDPDEQEINRRAAEIRETWSDAERLQRAAVYNRPVPWRVPGEERGGLSTGQ
jgi:hypothetical protein